MKGKGDIIPKVIHLKLFLDHFWLWKSQEGLNDFGRVDRAQAAHPPLRQTRYARDNVILRGRQSMSLNNLRTISLKIKDQLSYPSSVLIQSQNLSSARTTFNIFSKSARQKFSSFSNMYPSKQKFTEFEKTSSAIV